MPRATLLAFFLTYVLFVSSNHAITQGDPKAVKGGTFTIGFNAYPKSVLFYLSFEEYAEAVDMMTFDTLVETDLETNEFIPLLAESWTISDDKKLFTFKLNKQAKFSDGVPLTAKDVKFTWDTLNNPKNKTVPFQAVLSSIESCTVIDDHTVQFKAKTVHFKNFEKIASLYILPQHYYSKGDFNKHFNDKMLASGPYQLESASPGQKIVLKRSLNYWASALPQNVGRYNFDRIVFKVVPDPNVLFEVFKKGEVDYFYFLSAKTWATETDGPLFQKKYIKKLKAENKTAYGTQGIYWNMRRPLFKDVRVRTALSHLMNREKWIKDLMYNNYIPAAGPVTFVSEFHPKSVKPLPYDPNRAKALLKEAGWTEIGSDGVLIKDGKRFEFELLVDAPSHLRYLTLYQEDMKKVGIKMNFRMSDWATAIRLMEDFNFDATVSSKSRGVDPADFAEGWGSENADRKGSANTCGYKNPDVDKLAAEIDRTFEKQKRIPLIHKLVEIIARDQPISFAWEPTFYRLGYWNRYAFPGKGYFTYSNWKTTYHYWWIDVKKDKALKAAKAGGKAFDG